MLSKILTSQVETTFGSQIMHQSWTFEAIYNPFFMVQLNGTLKEPTSLKWKSFERNDLRGLIMVHTMNAPLILKPYPQHFTSSI